MENVSASHFQAANNKRGGLPELGCLGGINSHEYSAHEPSAAYSRQNRG